MALLPAVLMAAGSVVSAIGTIQEGREQQRQANFQARQAEIQAQEEVVAGNIAATNARQAEADSEVQWVDTMRERTRLLGEQRAAVAKSGLQLTGSAVDVQRDSALEFERQASRSYFSGLNVAGNYRAESGARMRSSLNMRATADNYRKAGKAARRASYFGAGATVLTGAARAFSMMPPKG